MTFFPGFKGRRTKDESQKTRPRSCFAGSFEKEKGIHSLTHESKKGKSEGLKKEYVPPVVEG
jgi:hypothetical protein